jgi:hypothetical protein
MLSVFLVVCFSALPRVTLEAVQTYAVPNEDGQPVMENPLALTQDEAGHLFMVDGEAKAVFHWDPSGRFVGSFGRSGSGPGEFQFGGGRGPNYAFLKVKGDEVFVLDGRKAKWVVFQKEGTFLRELPFEVPRSRILSFQAINDQQLFLQNRSRSDDGFFMSILLVDQAGTVLSTLKKIPDDTFTFSGAPGRSRNFQLKAYNASLRSAYDAHRNAIVCGVGDEPTLEVIDLSGKVVGTIDLPLVRQEVTESLKEAFKKQDWLQDRPGTLNIDFPEKMPYFSSILTLKGGQILVFNETAYLHILDGVLIDGQNQVTGRLNLQLGEGNRLMENQGTLFRLTLNEQDDFVLQKLQLKTL